MNLESICEGKIRGLNIQQDVRGKGRKYIKGA